MAETALLGKAAENPIVVASVAGHETVRAGKFEAGLVVAERRGEPRALRVAPDTGGAERAHVRIAMARSAFRRADPDRGLRSVAGEAVQAVMCAAERVLAEIVEAAARFETRGGMASVAGRSKHPLMDIFVTGSAIQGERPVDVVGVALIARHIEMSAVQAEFRLPFVVELDFVEGAGGVTTRAFRPELGFVKVDVTGLATPIEPFVLPLLVAFGTGNRGMFADQREGGVLVVVERRSLEALLCVTGGAGLFELTRMRVDVAGVAIGGLGEPAVLPVHVALLAGDRLVFVQKVVARITVVLEAEDRPAIGHVAFRTLF